MARMNAAPSRMKRTGALTTPTSTAATRTMHQSTRPSLPSRAVVRPKKTASASVIPAVAGMMPSQHPLHNGKPLNKLQPGGEQTGEYGRRDDKRGYGHRNAQIPET